MEKNDFEKLEKIKNVDEFADGAYNLLYGLIAIFVFMKWFDIEYVDGYSYWWLAVPVILVFINFAVTDNIKKRIINEN